MYYYVRRLMNMSMKYSLKIKKFYDHIYFRNYLFYQHPCLEIRIILFIQMLYIAIGWGMWKIAPERKDYYLGNLPIVNYFCNYYLDRKIRSQFNTIFISWEKWLKFVVLLYFEVITSVYSNIVTWSFIEPDSMMEK